MKTVTLYGLVKKAKKMPNSRWTSATFFFYENLAPATRDLVVYRKGLHGKLYTYALATITITEEGD